MRDVRLTEFYETSFNKQDLEVFVKESIGHTSIIDYPVIYLLRNDKKIYIGETSSVRSRMISHLGDYRKKGFKEIDIIYHPLFNKSATYNIETNLIRYMLADSRGLIPTNESQTKMKHSHNYYDKRFFNQDLFEFLWEELRTKGIAKDKLDIIRDKDIYKISPFTELNEEQMVLREKIVDFSIKHKDNKNGAILLISGEAGTGKSVLLSSTLKRLMDEAEDSSSPLYGMSNNYLLVHHGEMIKTYEEIARRVENFKVNQFIKPTTFINQLDKIRKEKDLDFKSDIVLIDEAHLLLSRSDAYNNFTYDNHLEEIVKRSKITIVIFDDKQVLKAKSYWDKGSFNKIKQNRKFEDYNLTTQMRMEANYLTHQWINDFIDKKITQIPNDHNFELKIFSDPKKMHEEIKKKDKKYGLSRVVSTFDYTHKKKNDGTIYYVEEGDLKLPWNNSYKNTWAENPESIDEVGSIYTIQGFDLNYVGVILGPSVCYDEEKDELIIDVEKYKDTEAFRNSDNIIDSNNNKIDQSIIKEQIILNSINVLMKRGIKGLYIYASNKELRYKLLALNNKNNIE